MSQPIDVDRFYSDPVREPTHPSHKPVNATALKAAMITLLAVGAIGALVGSLACGLPGTFGCLEAYAVPMIALGVPLALTGGIMLAILPKTKSDTPEGATTRAQVHRKSSSRRASKAAVVS